MRGPEVSVYIEPPEVDRTRGIQGMYSSSFKDHSLFAPGWLYVYVNTYVYIYIYTHIPRMAVYLHRYRVVGTLIDWREVSGLQLRSLQHGPGVMRAGREAPAVPHLGMFQRTADSRELRGHQPYSICVHIYIYIRVVTYIYIYTYIHKDR